MMSTSVRSSLEVMLENLWRIDEKPDDTPLALPSRSNSKARLPSSWKLFLVDGKRKSEINEVERSVIVQEEEGRERVGVSTSGRDVEKKKIRSDQSLYGPPEEERKSLVGGVISKSAVKGGENKL